MPDATTATTATATTTSMLGATTTTTTTDTNTTMPGTTILANTTTSETSMDSNPLELTCRTCVAKFESKELKRVHMRDDWHVYNLKRRIADLKPISQTTYLTQIRRSPSLSSDEVEEEEEEVSETDSEIHTLSPEASSEDEEYSESGEESSEQEAEERPDAIRIGDDLYLKSGKILGHRSHARQSRQHHRPQQQQQQSQAAPISPSTSPSTSSHLSPETANLILSHRPSHPPHQDVRMELPAHSLVVRKGTETSLVGIPEKQQRALLAVSKKMEASAGRTMNEFRAGVDKRGNCQKTFRVKSIGKKAGGLEKRLG